MLFLSPITICLWCHTAEMFSYYIQFTCLTYLHVGSYVLLYRKGIIKVLHNLIWLTYGICSINITIFKCMHQWGHIVTANIKYKLMNVLKYSIDVVLFVNWAMFQFWRNPNRPVCAFHIRLVAGLVEVWNTKVPWIVQHISIQNTCIGIQCIAHLT